jgi:hypothetical protein
MKLRKQTYSLVGLLLAVFFALFSPLAVKQTQAVEAGSTYMRCDRMKTGISPGSCLIVFTTSSTAVTETSIKLTLDSEWVSGVNFSATAGNYTVSTAGLPAGVDAMPGINTANNVSGNTIRFPITDLTVSTDYGFYITNGGTGLISNPTSSTTIVHTIFTRTGSDAATADTKDVAVPIIANDQIVITATVAPTFTFVFNNNAQSLALAVGSVISGTGTTITVTTNAASGWSAWALSANQSLDSAASGDTIVTTGTVNDTPDTISAGTEGYVLDVDLTTDGADGGTVTIDPEYNGTTTSMGGTLSATYEAIATANGAASSDVITLIPRVAISGLTEAATDYTDTLTVVGAGIF